MWQMSGRKTANERVAGFSKQQTVQGNFVLLAIAPFFLLMPSDLLGWSRGLVWWAWFWVSVVWAIIIFGALIATYWRAVRRLMRRTRR